MGLSPLRIILLLSLFVLATSLLSSEAKQPSKSTKPEKSIDGVYLHQKPNAIFNAKKQNWEKEKTTDCLELRTVSSTEVSLETFLLQTNGHMCSLKAKATRNGNRLLINGADNPESDLPTNCRLQLEIFPDRFVFHDPDHICRESCGVRAGFDGVVISRKGTKQPLGSKRHCSVDY